ncbi:MAG: sigma-70 family RNA polymerase sigma factor [Hyphomonadaceae bacterium]
MSEASAIRDEIVSLIPRLRRFARTLAGSEADADDLVQLALERALTRLGQFEPGTQLASWLYRIVRNAWIDEVRARQRRGRLFAPAEEGEFVGGGGAEEMETRLEMRAVEDAMQQLPEEQREAIGLVCVEGLSYREAADVLGVPIGTITSRLARGRETLMARLSVEA